MDDFAEKWEELLDKTIAAGPKVVCGSEEFDAAIDHIIGLLQNSSHLLRNGSHSTATFLSITAIEEIAKVHVGIYRSGDRSARKDPLFNHKDKHRLAAAPVLEIGLRPKDAAWEEPFSVVLNTLRTEGLANLREHSLYLDRDDNGLSIPARCVSVTTARMVLLLALEIFDDALVGYTNRSYEAGRIAADLFTEWAGA